MVNKASIQTYMNQLPPQERAKFAKLSESEQISIMNKSVGSAKFVGNSVFDANSSAVSDKTFVANKPIEMLSMKSFNSNQEYDFENFIRESKKEENLSPKQKQLRKAVVDHMVETYNSAKSSFEKRLKKDGWAGDVADGISAIWNNDIVEITGNRAEYVQRDLDAYKRQIEKLKKSMENGTFKETFKEIFGVPYKEDNVKAFQNVKEAFKEKAIVMAESKYVDDLLSGPLKKYNANNGEYKDNVEILETPYGPQEKTSKKEYDFMVLKDSVTKVVGGEEAIATIAKQSNLNLSELTDEQKYKFYGEIAKKVSEASTERKNNVFAKNSIEDYMNAYEIAYTQAFGDKNDIQDRVEKYNSSQAIGSSVLKTGTKAVMTIGGTTVVTLSGGTATPLVVAGITAATSFAVEASDKAANDIENDFTDNVGNLAKNAVIDGVFAYTGGSVAAGLGKLAPSVSKNKTIKSAWDMTSKALGTAVESGAKDILKGDFSNITPEKMFARTLISSVMGKVKIETAGVVATTAFSVSKKMLTQATYSNVKLKIEEQAKTDKNAQKVLRWIDETPDEFKKVVTDLVI